MARFMVFANWIALMVFSWALIRSDIWSRLIQMALALFALAPASWLIAARANAHSSVVRVALVFNSLVGVSGVLAVLFGSVAYLGQGTFLFFASLGGVLVVAGVANVLALQKRHQPA